MMNQCQELGGEETLRYRNVIARYRNGNLCENIILEKIPIIHHSASTIGEKSASTKTKVLRYIRWRQSTFKLIGIDKLNKIKHSLVKYTYKIK